MESIEAVAALMSPEGRVDPYPLYRVLHAGGPALDTGTSGYVVTSYAAIDAVLRDPYVLVADASTMDRAWPDWRDHRSVASIATSMLRTNAPDHTRMRRLASGAFTARRVAGLRDTVEAQAAALVADMRGRLAAGETVDVMDAFAYPLPIGVICALLGVPPGDHAWFRQRAGDLTAVLEPDIDVAELDTADRGTREMEAYLEDLVARRRRTSADDLTTALVRASDADPDQLSGDELLANLLLLLVAGFETTTNLIGNGLVTLMDHPRAAAGLDPDTAPAYVEEFLRYDSPVQLTSRLVTRPTRVPGLDLPAGAWLMLLLGAANRDPARFGEPDRFDPWRADGGPISFGAGAHYCLGAPLARLEARIALPLLRDLPGLALAGEPERRDRLTLRGYARLPVTTTP
ncbi:MAG TPA: cytochrome P450 [Asanoa sp.]